MPAETLIGIFLDAVSAYRKPDQFLRKTGSGWEPIPADRALMDVESLGLALRELGVGKGDRVALLSENRYEWPVADLAVLGLGAVTVPLYPTLIASQCRFILESSGARIALVSTASQGEKALEAAGERSGLEVVHMDPAPARPRTHSFQALLERGRELRGKAPRAFHETARGVSADDLATLIYTSGTTGEPKGAMLTHGNIASNVWACRQIIDLGPRDRCLSFLPLCHIFERMAGLYAMLSAGVSIAYAENLESVAANAVEVRPTLLTGVPRFYEKVHQRVLQAGRASHGLRRALFSWGLAVGTKKARWRFAGRRAGPLLTLQAGLADRLVASKIRARVGGRLRFCISGGAPLSPDVMEFFFAVGIPILEGYGLTETSPVISLNRPGREKPGSVGPPIPGVEVRIGEEGEILTRGPHVMRGYYRDEESTRVCLRDGWFHTGDVGYLDAEGFLIITDRLKDLLVTAGGKKVAPQPLEARLKADPWVSEAVLLGDRRPYVVCLLVPDFARLESEARSRGWPHAGIPDLIQRPEVREIYQRLIDRLNADLSRFEQVKQFALLDRELSQEGGELTPTLKVKRRVVMERHASTIDRLYAPGAETAA